MHKIAVEEEGLEAIASRLEAIASRLEHWRP